MRSGIKIFKNEIKHHRHTLTCSKIAAFGIPLYTFKEYMFLKIATQSISN